MNQDWVELKTPFDEATVFINPQTGEIWFSGSTYSFEVDSESFRALFYEMEKKGLYDR